MVVTLTEYRRNAGYDTQEKLAKIIGVGRSTVARWESGKRYPRTLTISKIAELLSVTEGEVISSITAAKIRNQGVN